MKKILWLASWYPNELNALTGDFIKRHAQACSLFQPVDVIHVKRLAAGARTKNNITVVIDPLFPNLRETVYYYTVAALGGIGSLFSYIYSLFLYHKLIKKYIRQYGKPRFLHVHVMLRCGLVALYYKWVHKIPYIVTEHYAGYMPEAKGYAKGIDLFNFLPLKCIAKNAWAVSAVSGCLAQAIKKKFNLKNTILIPNVVNTNIFYPVYGARKSTPAAFLHISTLSSQKNPGQMLAAFAILKKEYECDFELWIVGPGSPALKQLAEDLQIGAEVKWLGETTQQNIALLMQQATALVLYSVFESFGCVNIEAMACGLPVIVSDLPVFKEYLQQGVTAWFAGVDNPGELANVLHSFIVGGNSINPAFIAGGASKFNYETTGKLLAGLYADTIDKQTLFLRK